MTNTDDQPLTKEQRQQIHDQIRQILGAALVAHELTNEESYEALIVLDIEEVQQRLLQKLWDNDTVGMVAFGQDSDEWIEKRLGDDA